MSRVNCSVVPLPVHVLTAAAVASVFTPEPSCSGPQQKPAALSCLHTESTMDSTTSPPKQAVRGRVSTICLPLRSGHSQTNFQSSLGICIPVADARPGLPGSCRTGSNLSPAGPPWGSGRLSGPGEWRCWEDTWISAWVGDTEPPPPLSSVD